ncbi:phage repressor protein [Salipiger aestuarii]|nr:phage repressor protein [Salipiger aestuarii]
MKAVFAANPALKPARVSQEAGLSQSAIRKMFENDEASPRLFTARNIAAVLGMTIEDIVAQGDGAAPLARPTIAIAGKVGAGAQVPVFDAYAKGDGPQVECPPGLPPRGVVAVEVEGDSMEPVYSAGDLIFYTRDTPDGVPSDVIGHRCVVEDEDGMGWVKQVKAGDKPGMFHLISLNPGANTMWNKKLKWAARVRLAWPAELARKV